MTDFRGPGVRSYELVIGLMVLLALGLAIAGGARAQESAVVLIYHRFGETKLPATDIQLDQFEAHLDELANGDYHVIALADMVAALRHGQPLPDRAVAITIDDAFRSVYEEALPRLRAKGFPFTLFVATDPVDAGRSGYMTWDELRTLIHEGGRIGNHTADHTSLLVATADAARRQIARASQRIEEELGVSPKLFAYPYGEYSLATRKIVADAGFDAAVAQYSGAIGRNTDLLALPRFALNEKYGNIGRFRLIADALALPVRDVVPVDPLITRNPPAFGFTVAGPVRGLSVLQCFPSHLPGAAALERLGKHRFEVRFSEPFPPGRSRINCTMPGPKGRWYWFGRPFFVASHGHYRTP